LDLKILGFDPFVFDPSHLSNSKSYNQSVGTLKTEEILWSLLAPFITGTIRGRPNLLKKRRQDIW